MCADNLFDTFDSLIMFHTKVIIIIQQVLAALRVKGTQEMG